jgi:hypothetical protein
MQQSVPAVPLSAAVLHPPKRSDEWWLRKLKPLSAKSSSPQKLRGPQ